ncbi:hypothetical protein AACH06_22030 [Ideonella sp. DXS29W]|uniref:Twin-arginine translocation signal domain-containing protein n=1 Tax=Ideonella lacteola TaxID=2984193 RepID=A0ABU9BWL0_9BURK
MTHRRTFLAAAAAAAALAAPLVSARTPGASRRAVPQGQPNEHFVPGGTRGIQRGMFTYTATDHIEEYDVIRLPEADCLYMIPLTKRVFDESNGAKFATSGDGTVTILKDDLYHLTTNMDWPAQPRGSGQDGYDVDMRKLMIMRARVGVKPPPYVQGQVTAIKDTRPFDRLAANDLPGSSAPKSLRSSFEWEPGAVQPGSMVYIDLQLPAGSFVPTVGDLVRVSHSSLADDLLGAKNVGLQISARMVGPGVARVLIENRYGERKVNVPRGSMNVLVESAVASAGNNNDAWCYLNSGPVMLQAGEKIFVAARTGTPGDFLQITDGSFLRVSNMVA